MKSTLSAVVIGNCQARPLAETITRLNPGVTISGVAIVHLLKDSDESAYTHLLESADLIFAQRVMDNYPCKFVRNVELRGKYGEKVLTWPNLYYAGYNPELTYLRGVDRLPLKGPLGDYHSETIIDAWLRGLSVAETASLHHDFEYNKKAYGDMPVNSLDEFRQREKETDVYISDWIINNLWKQRLFFTFNHPAQVLINELALRLASIAAIEVKGRLADYADHPEPLGLLSLPMNPWVAKYFSRSFEDDELYRGVEVVSIEQEQVRVGKRKKYELVQLIQEYFNIYDLCGEALKK